MLILNTETCPTVRLSEAGVFVTLRVRNPSTGRLMNSAGFYVKLNEALMLHQRLLKAAISVLDRSRNEVASTASIIDIQR